jgi:hypothetical protein
LNKRPKYAILTIGRKFTLLDKGVNMGAWTLQEGVYIFLGDSKQIPLDGKPQPGDTILDPEHEKRFVYQADGSLAEDEKHPRMNCRLLGGPQAWKDRIRSANRRMAVHNS